MGSELHQIDQILVFVQGNGITVINGRNSTVTAGTLALVQAGTMHNFINTSKSTDLKLFAIYSPQQHTPCSIHVTKADATKDERIDSKNIS